MKLSRLAEEITTSPILTIAAQINEKKAAGENIFNFTVGDFDSNIFPIPDLLKEETVKAYEDNQTNYPGAFGMPEFREGIAQTLNRICGLNYTAAEVQIASGSRPLIYACYQVIVDPGDKVVFPGPSWNNDYYTLLTNTRATVVETSPENDFMPTADELRPHLDDAQMLALCSPQNPTGTVFTRERLKEICDLVVDVNQRRAADEKPLYVMFDQVYWLLTFGDVAFHHPLSVCPKIKDYAVFIDGLSKSFAGTGIRVGWATAPAHILPKMRALIAHIGAWAPKPEQVAAGKFLLNTQAVDAYLDQFRAELQNRLQGFYDGFMALKNKGFPVDAIAPQAAIYLTVKIDLVGKTTPDGIRLTNADAVHEYLLNTVKLGVLPFSWFGAKSYGDWFRISVGTCRQKDVTEVLKILEANMAALS
jgi:aspartate aminotransferase